MTRETSQPHDIEKLLRLLFLERKRVKDLNEKVQELDAHRPTPPNIAPEVEHRVTEKLKRLILLQQARIQELERREPRKVVPAKEREYEQLGQQYAELEAKFHLEQQASAALQVQHDKLQLDLQIALKKGQELEESALLADQELYEIKRLYQETQEERGAESAAKRRLAQGIEQREREIDELRKQITEEMVHRAQVASERQCEREKFEKEIAEYAQRIEERGRALSNLERRMSEEMISRKEMEQALGTIALLERERGDRQEREEQLQAALDLAEGEIERLKGEWFETQSHCALQGEQMALFAVRLGMAQEELSSLKGEVAENEALHQQIASQQESVEFAQQSHLAEIKRLQVNHQEIVHDLHRQIGELKERVTNAQKVATDCEAFERQFTEVEAECTLLRTSHAALQEEHRQLHEACQAARQGVAEREEQLEKIQVQWQRHQEEQASLRRQVRERDQQLQTVQRHLAKKLKESALLQQSSEEVKEQLAEQERREQELRGELSALSLEKALAEERVRSAESRAKQAEGELQHAKRSCADLERESAALRREIGELGGIRDRYVRVDAEYRQMRQIFSSIRSSLGNVESAPSFETQQVNEIATPNLREGRTPSPPAIREDLLGESLLGQEEREPAGLVQEDLFG